MTGDTHYDLEILAELAEGLLDAATAMRVREHLAICDPCGESLADLAAVREVLAATPTPAMPMGVALRIDRALAAEAESFRGGGVGLVEAPAWDDIMRDAPWETSSPAEPAPWETTPQRAPLPEQEPELEPAVRLGVVGDDGTVVPVVPARRRGANRRRRWAMPAAAAGVAAAVIGATVLATGTLSASGPDRLPTIAQPAPADTIQYTLTDSNWNYTDAELRGSLLGYIGPGTIVGTTDNSRIDKCVRQVSAQVGKSPFAVDQGFYNGQEANILLFWQNQAKNTVRVHVVGPQCDDVRKPDFASWE
ncbi:zf-HC2 domain-containing protein [Streptosporangium sp. NBC_01469]|uniref:zf-HC2 domain-containing protein n=1 Tax=Streptosporangium sp. NBC_01469 TaxID=2903898 RepID=UPI002E2908A8|nr:zf-HC2 domain-containing protein [Streptosporangium sp. NBC_01469]